MTREAKITTAIIVVLAGGMIAIFALGGGGSEPLKQGIDGVKTFGITDQTHTKEAVTYEQKPPVAGPHNPEWLDCNGKVYTDQVSNEKAVHGLEHGAVWITYKGSVSDEDVSRLKGKVEGAPYTFMSPYPDQPAAITLTAWDHQLELESATDSRIDDFLTTYRQGDQTPEPGASCTAPTAPME